jgi:hypothetical protein
MAKILLRKEAIKRRSGELSFPEPGQWPMETPLNAKVAIPLPALM